MGFEFKIMRSLIYVGLAKEEYRPKLMDWLYRHHIPDSISTFDHIVLNMPFIKHILHQMKVSVLVHVRCN